MDLIHLNRRRVLAAIGSSTAALLLPGALARAAQGPAGPPVARKEPVRESLWGEEIVDPYRWMENPKDAEWEPFMKGQAAHARRVLDAIPGPQGAVSNASASSLAACRSRACRRSAAKGRLFYEMRPTGANQFKLYMREGVNGAERLLVDPSTLRGPNDVHMSLDWWAASPDGRYVVYGLSAAGSEDSVLQVLDVDSRQGAARAHRPHAVRLAELAARQQRLLLQPPGRGREAGHAPTTTSTLSPGCTGWAPTRRTT